MRNIKLTIAYDGTNYHGWQIQPNARSIQQTIEEAISKMTKEKVKVIGAGRTDAGVHACGQVASFHTNSTILPERFKSGLNHFLPEDIRIIESEEVAEEFHPRFDAHSKTYCYIVDRSENFLPMKRNYRLHMPYALDIEKMKQAATHFIGKKDYTSYMGPRSFEVNPIREITDIEIEEKEEEVIFTIRGQSFLRNMVRIMVGSLLEVGRGKWSIEQLKESIEAKNRTKAGPTIKPNGLYLIDINYEKEKIK